MRATSRCSSESIATNTTPMPPRACVAATKAAAFGSCLTEAKAPVERLIAAGLEWDSARQIARSGILGAACLVIPIPAVRAFRGVGAAGQRFAAFLDTAAPGPRSSPDPPPTAPLARPGPGPWARVLERPALEGGDQVGLPDQAVLKRKNSKKQISVGRAAAIGNCRRQRSPSRPSSGGSGRAPSLRLRQSSLGRSVRHYRWPIQIPGEYDESPYSSEALPIRLSTEKTA